MIYERFFIALPAAIMFVTSTCAASEDKVINRFTEPIENFARRADQKRSRRRILHH